jgi:hypothetical protein
VKSEGYHGGTLKIVRSMKLSKSLINQGFRREGHSDTQCILSQASYQIALPRDSFYIISHLSPYVKHFFKKIALFFLLVQAEYLYYKRS